MKKLLFFFCLSAFAFCTNPEKSAEINESQIDSADIMIPNTGNTDVSGCYMRILGRDSFVAVIRKNGDSITGRLNFDNYQKDASSGIIEGRMENDVLKLRYSFTSEGMNSVMDVYFLAAENYLVRGIGEMAVAGDTAYYKDPSVINYPENERWEKVDCKNVAEKYKQ